MQAASEVDPLPCWAVGASVAAVLCISLGRFARRRPAAFGRRGGRGVGGVAAGVARRLAMVPEDILYSCLPSVCISQKRFECQD
jgi:hypothetical protein